MCVTTEDPSKRPAAELAALFEKHLGVSGIDPVKLEWVLLTRWSRVAHLAHAIHEVELRRARNLTKEECQAYQASGMTTLPV